MSFANAYKAIIPSSRFFLDLASLCRKKKKNWALYDNKYGFINDLVFKLLEAEHVSYSGGLGPEKANKSLCLTSHV